MMRRIEEIKKDEPFFNTVRDGDLAKIKEMVEAGANVNAMNMSECTVMMLAGNYGRVDIMQYLLEKGARVITKTVDGQLAINVPVQECNFDVINFYIKQGLDINAAGNLKITALHQAVDISDDEKRIIMLELLKRADGLKSINHIDYDGNTPIMKVIKNDFFLRDNATTFKWF